MQNPQGNALRVLHTKYRKGDEKAKLIYGKRPEPRKRVAGGETSLLFAGKQRVQLEELAEFPEGKLHFGNFLHQLHFLLIQFFIVSTHVVFAPFVGFHRPL